MSVSSFQFLVFIGVVAVIYYILPLKYRWLAVLIGNIYFVYQNNGERAELAMITLILVAWLFGILTQRIKSANTKRWICVAAMVVECGTLLLTKDSVFFDHFTRQVGYHMPSEWLGWFAPLGISYFALTLISYIMDVYWGTQKVQKNPLKFMTYISYFPTLTSGPIMKYGDCAGQILEGKHFQYENLCYGAQRILWGFFKKIVIAERLSVLVSAIYDDPATYTGMYLWIASAAFVMQLYCDFSGCIDIIMGASQMMGIQLPENFDLPFASASISEFWRRWHITLGTWLKEYVFYPLLKSALWQKLAQKSKKVFGKKWGKKVPVWLGLFVTWFSIGLWHGGSYNYIWGVGLWMWLVIVSGELLTPVFEKIIRVAGIKTDCFSWHFFQCLRTCFIFMVGLAAFRAGDWTNTINVYKEAVSVFNPWIIWDGSFLKLGLTAEDYRVLAISVLIIAVAGIVKLTHLETTLRELISRQNVLFRWLLWFALFLFVLIWGKYGPGYNAAEFIYRGF